MRTLLTTLTILILGTIILNAQTYELTMEHDSLQREYTLYVPPIYEADAEPVPLIIALHGLTNNGNILKESSKFELVADTANFIVSYPTAILNGLGQTAWTNGLVVGSGANDSDFLLRMIDTISTNYNIDADRIYMTGFSMGGFMSNRMACEFSDKIAAIASHSGTIADPIHTDCAPTRPFPMMHLHGTSDFVVSYDGNWLGGIESVDTLMRFWRNHNLCANYYTVLELDDSFDDGLTIEKNIYGDCENNIELWLYNAFNHGHAWLQPENDIFASAEIWKFFSRYSLNPAFNVNNEAIKEETSIDLYPNPAQDHIYLSLPEKIKDGHLSIFNIQGQLVWEQAINQALIDISHLEANIYFVKIQNQEFQKTIKLIIKR